MRGSMSKKCFWFTGFDWHIFGISWKICLQMFPFDSMTLASARLLLEAKKIIRIVITLRALRFLPRSFLDSIAIVESLDSCLVDALILRNFNVLVKSRLIWTLLFVSLQPTLMIVKFALMSLGSTALSAASAEKCLVGQTSDLVSLSIFYSSKNRSESIISSTRYESSFLDSSAWVCHWKSLDISISKAIAQENTINNNILLHAKLSPIWDIFSILENTKWGNSFPKFRSCLLC